MKNVNHIVNEERISYKRKIYLNSYEVLNNQKLYETIRRNILFHIITTFLNVGLKNIIIPKTFLSKWKVFNID